jgi:hypothetical protein
MRDHEKIWRQLDDRRALPLGGILARQDIVVKCAGRRLL